MLGDVGDATEEVRRAIAGSCILVSVGRGLLERQMQWNREWLALELSALIQGCFVGALLLVSLVDPALSGNQER